MVSNIHEECDYQASLLADQNQTLEAKVERLTAEIGELTKEVRSLEEKRVDLNREIGERDAQLQQIARLAKHTLDGHMADGEEWNTMNAIYWHAIGEAEPDSETTKDPYQAGHLGCEVCGHDHNPNERCPTEKGAESFQKKGWNRFA
jgi:NTP pyrophosphatase (non-canonical NTP hydrolase)